MRAKFVFLVSFVLFILVSTMPAFAIETDGIPENICPQIPAISACNINYILNTNLLAVSRLVVGSPNNPTSIKNSLAGQLTSGMGPLLVTPPVSSREYLVYMGHKFHVPGTPITAYASDGGIGYNSITPILRIWTATRNIAYFFFSVVFVIIGVMIMIRSKIDPKTAMTVQNALPKIILALLMVTFSYAIAGFLIDIMYVSLGLIVTIVKLISANGVVGTQAQLEQLLNGSIFEFVTNGGWWSTTSGVASVVSNVTYNMIAPILSGAGGAIASLISGGLGLLIVGIAIIWALVKTWIALISAYANLILAIIFAPLQLMIDAIPGQKQLENWVRTMLGNLLPFPVVVVMLTIGSAIVSNFGQGWENQTGFIPPLLGVGDMSGATALVGLGILLTIPKSVEMVQQLVKTPQSKWSTAWSDALNAGRGSATAFGRAGWTASTPIRQGIDDATELSSRVRSGATYVKNTATDTTRRVLRIPDPANTPAPVNPPPAAPP